VTSIIILWKKHKIFIYCTVLENKFTKTITIYTALEVLILDVRASVCVCLSVCPCVFMCSCVRRETPWRMHHDVLPHATSMRARQCSAGSLPGWSRVWRGSDLCGPMQCCYQRPPASNARPAGCGRASHHRSPASLRRVTACITET